jgi:hypothetical protein
MRDEPGHHVVRQDELETFGRNVEHFTVMTVEHARREREPAMLKLTMFVRAPEGQGRNAFWQALRSCLAGEAAAPLIDATSAYVESPALDVGFPVSRAATPDRDLFPRYDGVLELGFASADALARGAAATGAWEAIARVLDTHTTRTVLVEQTLLYDELEGVDWIAGELLALRRQQRAASGR